MRPHTQIMGRNEAHRRAEPVQRQSQLAKRRLYVVATEAHTLTPSLDFSCGDAPVLDFVPAPDFTLAEALDNAEQLTLSAPRRPRPQPVTEVEGGTADRRASCVSSWRRSVSVSASSDASPPCTDEWENERASWAAERAALLSRLRRHEREREQYESVIAQMEGEVDRVRARYECERVEVGRSRAKERVKARRERERWAEERAELVARVGRCKCRPSAAAK